MYASIKHPQSRSPDRMHRSRIRQRVIRLRTDGEGVRQGCLRDMYGPGVVYEQAHVERYILMTHDEILGLRSMGLQSYMKTKWLEHTSSCPSSMPSARTLSNLISDTPTYTSGW